MYNDNKYFYYTRRCIIKMFIYFNYTRRYIIIFIYYYIEEYIMTTNIFII